MGAAYSCTSQGATLVAAAVNGDTQAARTILAKCPGAALFCTFVDRNSPLLIAAGRGHYRLLQCILETAVISEGPEKAKRCCINHVNAKGQSALTLACMNGHSQCVEYLVCNGANPLLVDSARHSTCLHWAASYCRSDCIQRLLGSSATYPIEGSAPVPIPDIPCIDDDNRTTVKMVDRHNGWGLTALHIAVFKGSTTTVRALLRNGSALDCRTTTPRLSGSPVLCPSGSTILHLAAQAGDISVVRVVLEAQVNQGGPDLRCIANDIGDKPLDCVRSTRNVLLMNLLDERVTYSSAQLALTRGLWERSLPAPHNIVAMLLQRLKLMLSLEVIALQARVCDPLLISSLGSYGPGADVDDSLNMKLAGHKGAPTPDGSDGQDEKIDTQVEKDTDAGTKGEHNDAKISHSPGSSLSNCSAAEQRDLLRLAELQQLLTATIQVSQALGEISQDGLMEAEHMESISNINFDSMYWTRYLMSRSAIAYTGGEDNPTAMVLSSLITPRTVSAMVQAAKMLVASSPLALRKGGEERRGRQLEGEGPECDYEYALALLKTALPAMRACLSAGQQILGSPNPVESCARAHGSRLQCRGLDVPDAGQGIPALAAGRDVVLGRRRTRGAMESASGTASADGSISGGGGGGSSTLLYHPLLAPGVADFFSRHDHGVLHGWAADIDPATRLHISSRRSRHARHGIRSAHSRLLDRDAAARWHVTFQEQLYPADQGGAGAASTPPGADPASPNVSRSPTPRRSSTDAPRTSVALEPAALMRTEAGEEAGGDVAGPPSSASPRVDTGEALAAVFPALSDALSEPQPSGSSVAAAAEDPTRLGACSPRAPFTDAADTEIHASAAVSVPRGVPALEIPPRVESLELSTSALSLPEPADKLDNEDRCCAICMDSVVGASVSSCSHAMCLHCAFQLCCKGKTTPLCPFCRQPIRGFDRAPFASLQPLK